MSSNHRYADRPGRQALAMEAAPGPTRGEPGEFRQDAKKQARILFEMRAFLEGVRRERAAGTWRAIATRSVKARRTWRGPAPFGSTGLT